MKQPKDAKPKQLRCMFWKERCNSDYAKGLKCNGINNPLDCPYALGKYVHETKPELVEILTSKEAQKLMVSGIAAGAAIVICSMFMPKRQLTCLKCGFITYSDTDMVNHLGGYRKEGYTKYDRCIEKVIKIG